MTKNKKEEYQGIDKNIRLSEYMDSDILLDGEVYSPKGTEEQLKKLKEVLDKN